MRNRLGIIKWFAYDSGFLPSIYNKQFLVWTDKGLTTYSSLLNQDQMFSFQELKDRFGLENQDHFRYLQIRDL